MAMPAPSGGAQRGAAGGAGLPVPPALPPGVSLQQIDGGPQYYGSHGFTQAAQAGWDSPSFFPIGVYFQEVSVVQPNGPLWNDLGINTIYLMTNGTSRSMMTAAGLWGWDYCAGGTLYTPGTPGPESVGLFSFDEPVDWQDAMVTPVGGIPNSVQDTRPWWCNTTYAFLYYQGFNTGWTSAYSLALTTPSQGSLAVPPPPATPAGGLGRVPRRSLPMLRGRASGSPGWAPNGRPRHVDIISADIYWFTSWWPSPALNGNSSGWRADAFYNLGGVAGTQAQSQCGPRYGDMVDLCRSFQQGGAPQWPVNLYPDQPYAYPAPILQIIENGQPFEDDPGDGSTYITPPQMNWSIWASIIHGARMILYFNHSFSGPGASDNNFAQAYYQSPQLGQPISIYAQAKQTNTLISKLAPVINSPTASGYVQVSPAAATFGGVETMVKYYQKNWWIFAEYRGAQSDTNISVTFTTADGYTGGVPVINADSASGSATYQVTAANGVFTDTFATGASVRIYKVGNH